MDSRHGRNRMNIEGDGLSSLPEDLIHKILSFVSIKHVVQTSVWSSRWRFIWTSMPYLSFSSEDFPSLPKFCKVVTGILARRNDQIEVVSLNLSLHGRVSRAFAERILKYALSHNVQRVTITSLIEKKIVFPFSVLCSQSLKQLTIIGSTFDHSFTRVSTWDLPALSTLHLDNVTLFDDDGGDKDYYRFDALISEFANLKNLTLNGCMIKGSEEGLDGFSICHPQLSNLTLENGYWGWDRVYVDAPQLKNLTIVNCDAVHLSATDLTSFTYKSDYSFGFSADILPSLEQVDVCIRNPRETCADEIVHLLQQIRSVKSLTLNLETIELLSSSRKIIANHPSQFVNLRSLKIYPVKIQLEGETQKKVGICNEVKNYLLDGSPSASFTLVTREEIKARDTTLAQYLMADLRVMLEQDKAEVNWDHMQRGKALMIEGYWDDLTMQSQLAKKKICEIISKLQHIEALLTKLPTSNRAKLKSSFSSLCAEANLVMKMIDHSTDVKCDAYRSCVSFYNELAKALQPS